jgi:hypothetical protein
MASITGRMVNLMSRRLPGLGRKGTQRQVAQFRLSDGKKGNKMMGKPILLGAERDDCVQLLVAGYPDFASYQELTDRLLPVALLSRKAD